MVIEEFIGKTLAAKLLGYSVDKCLDSFRQPQIIGAFEKACLEVTKEEEHLFDNYSAQALGLYEERLDEESLWSKLEVLFASNEFPNEQRLTEMLFESWELRKKQLSPSEASDFFSLSEDVVRPIIQKISKRFFFQLTLIPEFSSPYVISQIQEFQRIYKETTAKTPLPSFEELKDAALKASTSLLSWPTTLGDGQWLERHEVDLLLDRIDANEKSTTILLGPPGSGKSALLSTLAKKLKDKGLPVLAIKADKLPSSIDSSEKLSIHFKLPIPTDTCLSQLAMEQKVILIVDQLDALSDIVDRKSERLNVLLDLIQSVSSLKNVHTISSSRWFEFKHDTRLNTIQAESLDLKPISWEQVQIMLTRASVCGQNWSGEARGILQVPLHLKIFIDLKIKNLSSDISMSLQGLLENLWKEKVLDREGASGKNTLVHKLAQKMSDNEELWVTRALADAFPEALEDLERQEILIFDESDLRIGFRHQTYFDFARARYFAQENESLSKYVIERQDGLFIRPTLLGSLEYLRNSDPIIYHRELLMLWNDPALRFHLRTLIVEFVATLKNPNDTEINCLLPVLKDECMLNRVLITMAGSPGWFFVVVKEDILVELMLRSPDKAALCAPLLIQALLFNQAAVINNVQKYWLNDPQYDALTLHVLQYLKVWDEQTTEMVCLVAKRTSDQNIPYIAEIVSQLNPSLAPRIVRSDLDRRFLEAKRIYTEQSLTPAPPDGASLDDLIAYSMHNDPQKVLKDLLENDLGWWDLSIIAESAPETFLDQIWPWFTSVLELIVDDSPPLITCYKRDYCLGTQSDRNHDSKYQLIASIKNAIVNISESTPLVFINFFKKNVTSSLLSVHCLLCKGLEKLVQNYPKIILEYLTEDPRRLAIGDFENHYRETEALISKVTPYLDRASLDSLEQAILEWNMYSQNGESGTVEDRRNRLKWYREHRLRLLHAFPDTCLSDRTMRICKQEERAFPELCGKKVLSAGGFVGSPMTADQMLKAKDPEILKLFEELVDSTGWDHPRFEKRDKLVGGIIPASRELGSFAEREPARAANLLANFKPGQQEMAVGEIVEGLAKSDFPSTELFQVVTTLDSAGFSKNNFRTNVALALEIRAKKDKGLPDKILALMESWLPIHPEPIHPEPILDNAENKEDNKQANSSILWGLGGSFSFPGGRDIIFEAICHGYLQRKPQAIQNWVKVLEKALKYEQHPDVWKVILRLMSPLFKGDKGIATNLYDQILTMFPRTRESTIAVIAVAKILPLVDDIEIIHKWMNFYKKGEWSTGYQAFGEMLIWHLCHKPKDTWAQNELQEALEDSQLIGVHRGMAFTAAHNWPNPTRQELCTSTLIKLSESEDQDVHEAISIVFEGKEKLLLNSNMRSIIEATISNDHLLMSSAINLIEGLESTVSREPQLVFDVCDRFLDLGIKDIQNTATRYAYLAEPLISIALTLHRMRAPYREKGLLLFERLSESNIQEARQALNTLDRRPLKNRSSNLPARRRRRHLRK